MKEASIRKGRIDFYCWRWSHKQSYPVKKGVLLPRLFINTSAEESLWVDLPLQTTNVSAWKCPITKAARKHKSVWQLLSPRAPRLESARRCARCCLLSLQFTPCLQVACSCPALADFATSQELLPLLALPVAPAAAEQERQRAVHSFTPYSGHNFKASLWFCMVKREI